MTQYGPEPPAARRASPYDDMPLSVVLHRYIWPFWLLRNAARGDVYARAAAYRHNRTMRIYLPVYVLRWSVCSALALGLTCALASVSSQAVQLDTCTLLAAACAVLFAGALTVLLVTTYLYVYLSWHDA